MDILTAYTYYLYCAAYGIGVGLMWAFVYSFFRWRPIK